MFGDQFKRHRVAEELRHLDQQIAVQKVQFVFVITHQFDVTRQRQLGRHLHPPFDSPVDGRRPILGEIQSELFAEQTKQLPDLVADDRPGFFFGVDAAIEIGRVVAIPIDQIGHRRWCRDDVDHARRDGRARHPGKSRRGNRLRQYQSAPRMDLLDAQRSVGTGARQNHRDRAVTDFISQRFEKYIDRQIATVKRFLVA